MVKKLKVLLKRMMIMLDASTSAVFGRKCVDASGRNQSKIVIVFQQLFGDAVVIQNSLSRYTEVFPKSEGYEITFLARPSVLQFMKETLPLPEEIKFEAMDFKRLVDEYEYYRECKMKYSNADVVVVPGTSLSAEIFAASSRANRKIGLGRSVSVKRPIYAAFLYKRAYTECVIPNKDEMMLMRHGRLLRHLGLNGYTVGLPQVLAKERLVPEKEYCVVCPGASKAEKCWPIERFVEVIDYIVEKYGMEVHLCGGRDELEAAERVMECVKKSKRVICHVGETSFSDWSAIVQHASLVVGNDSATMHLAVAARRKAICIAGVYDKFQFFPYQVEREEEMQFLPIVLYRDMPCEWCRTIGYDAGYGNEECKKRIKNNCCSTCIDLISVEAVIEAVDKILS